jgi:hypothetical protein
MEMTEEKFRNMPSIDQFYYAATMEPRIYEIRNFTMGLRLHELHQDEEEFKQSVVYISQGNHWGQGYYDLVGCGEMIGIIPHLTNSTKVFILQNCKIEEQKENTKKVVEKDISTIALNVVKCALYLEKNVATETTLYWDVIRFFQPHATPMFHLSKACRNAKDKWSIVDSIRFPFEIELNLECGLNLPQLFPFHSLDGIFNQTRRYCRAIYQTLSHLGEMG